ncbi:MAG: DNA cytosine methyltransferase [Bacteroidetes bacterium]|nr:DNA cytosine methyltransferase [Bacteroidota bacterium]
MKKEIKKNQSSDVPVLSFFTGGGFLDIGFEKAGFYPIWTNEVNTAFAKLYAYGMTRWRQSVLKEAPRAIINSKRSIENLYAPEIIRQAFSEGRPDFFGIIGGPPCPDFSIGGKNEGGGGINGRLTETFINRIIKIKPSFFVLENVSGLYRTKKHRAFLTGLEDKLERNDYCLDLKVLNALNLGVPQDRERLFIVGIQRNLVIKSIGKNIDVKERGWFPWPLKRKYLNAKKRYNWPGIVLNGKEPSLPESLPFELTVNSVLGPGNNPSKLQNGNDVFQAYSKKFSIIKEGDTKRKSFKRLHRHRFSPTACYGNNEVHLHPWEKRRLSVREAMRIQCIPDSYSLPEDSTLTLKFKLVSNGVPVPLSYELAKKLKRFFSK